MPSSGLSGRAHDHVSHVSSSKLNLKIVEKPQMLEINPGIWDGLSPEQAKKYYPGDWERFIKDPYSYRVPRAESYHDLSGIVFCFYSCVEGLNDFADSSHRPSSH
jgi:broad specificity phosphatase PhoE